MLAQIAFHYNLDDATTQPWHLKATYQLFDNLGKPSEQGIYEFWWTAPGTYRVSWARKSAHATVWVNAASGAVFQGHPELIGYAEGLLGIVFANPLPRVEDIDGLALESQPLTLGQSQLQCVKSGPKVSAEQGSFRIAQVPKLSVWCVGTDLQSLRIMMGNNGEIVNIGAGKTFKDRYVPGQASFFRGKLHEWDATITDLEDTSPTDAEATFPSNAKALQNSIPESMYPSVQPMIASASGSLLRSIRVSDEFGSQLMTSSIRAVIPSGLDPKQFKRPREVFNVLIDGSGKVQLANPVSGPPQLQEAALNALLQFKFNPILSTTREPIDTSTKVTVEF